MRKVAAKLAVVKKASANLKELERALMAAELSREDMMVLMEDAKFFSEMIAKTLREIESLLIWIRDKVEGYIRKL